jgi:glutamate carboxypeptidase
VIDSTTSRNGGDQRAARDGPALAWRVHAETQRIADRAIDDLRALVEVSSPSGDSPGAERTLGLVERMLPRGASCERLPCSTPDCAPDWIGRITGSGSGRLLLLGHIDTVIAHDAHQPLRLEGPRLYGSGALDMKGGDVLALGVMRALAERPTAFAEIALLLVTDEEWRTVPFAHAARFADWDTCLCFEAGQQTDEGEHAVIVRRKAAGTLRISAKGRAAHAGLTPQDGRNALLGLAELALGLAKRNAPDGPDELTVVPTMLRSGDASNVVPATGELTVDVRAASLAAVEKFAALARRMPIRDGQVEIEVQSGDCWPGLDSREPAADVLASASRLIGQPIRAMSRGGASDASHLAASIALTIDGLGPCGAGAHSPGEYVLAESLPERAAVALAITQAALAGTAHDAAPGPSGSPYDLEASS